MFVCKAVVLTCSLLILNWGMTADGGLSAYDDMKLYSVMCSISTFTAFGITMITLVVPEQVRFHRFYSSENSICASV